MTPPLSLILNRRSWTLATTPPLLRDAKEDAAAKYEVYAGNPSSSFSRTLEEEDIGKTLCVRTVLASDPEGSGVSFNGHIIRRYAGAEEQASQTTGSSPIEESAGKQAGGIPDAGPGDDLLLGSLFAISLATSVSCVLIWRNNYRLRNPK